MINQSSSSSNKNKFRNATVGGVGFSALALALWLSGTTQPISQANAAGTVDEREAQNREVTTRLVEIRKSSHTYPPQNINANGTKEVFQYALLDNKNFQPNVFTGYIDGINDKAELTAGNEKTIGVARLVTIRKPGLPTDPSDPRAHVGVHIDISGLKTVKAEAGWYEATFMYTTKIPPVAPPRANGLAQFGTMTPEDYQIMSSQGEGYNGVVGHVFTKGGVAPRYPSRDDVWPDEGSNLVSFPVTAGAFNALKGDDAHHYFEFMPETNMVFPHQEFPFAGGVPALHPPLGSFADGTLGHILSIVPGSGPFGINNNDPHIYGDNPSDPRDPDRFESIDPAQKEFRLRSVPSGLTEEIHRDVFIRRASFHPEENNLERRLFFAMAYEYSLVDTNNDGVLTFEELDIDGTSDGGQSNERLYFAITEFDRLIIQREINDGMIVPRFANSQRAWVLNGDMKSITGERIRDRQLAESEIH